MIPSKQHLRSWNQSPRLVLVVSLGMLTSLTGCNSNAPAASRPKVSQVTGRVTCEGKPLKGAFVTFYPISSDNSGTGETDEDGHFAISTFAKNDGAVLGEHTVTIFRPELGSVPGMSSQSSTEIPSKYTAKEKTPLTANVVEGSNQFEFVVK